MRGRVIITAGLLLLVGLGVYASGGGEEEARTDEPRLSPEGILEAWLDAVRDGRADEACGLMTENAQAGFRPNEIGLPETAEGRSCEETVRLAGEELTASLSVGEAESTAGGCRVDGEAVPAIQVEWRSRRDRYHMGWQILCRVAEDRWKLDDRIWVEFTPL